MVSDALRALNKRVAARDPMAGGLAVLLVALVLGFAIVLPDRFLSVGTLQSMAFQLPELGILSLATMITLLCGGINLAIIATANFAALTIAYILQSAMPVDPTGTAGVFVMLLSVLAGLTVAGLIGLITGWIIAYAGVSPILATLGTMTLVRGMSVGLTHGNVLSGFPAPILFIGNGIVLGVPMAILVFVACAIPLAVMLGRTPFGIGIYMIGSNEQATQFSGIDTRRV